MQETLERFGYYDLAIVYGWTENYHPPCSIEVGKEAEMLVCLSLN